MSRSVIAKQLADEASAGWITYGTSRAAFYSHLSFNAASSAA
jgi:hypothetical protein